MILIRDKFYTMTIYRPNCMNAKLTQFTPRTVQNLNKSHLVFKMLTCFKLKLLSSSKAEIIIFRSILPLLCQFYFICKFFYCLELTSCNK